MQGTSPFMAIATLQKKKVLQNPAHDLESIYYVLLYFCLKYTRPGVTRPLKAIDDWFMQVSFEWIGLKKKYQLENIDSLLEQLEPFFADLSGCLRELWDVLFEPEYTPKGHVWRDLDQCVGTHDGMLHILEATLLGLPDVDPVAASPPLTKSLKPPLARKSSTKSLKPPLTKPNSRKQSSTRKKLSSSRQAPSAPVPSSSQQPPSRRSLSLRKRRAQDSPPREDSDSGVQPVGRSRERAKRVRSNTKRA